MDGQRVVGDSAAGEDQRLPGQEEACSENGVSTPARTARRQITGSVWLNCELCIVMYVRINFSDP